MTPATTTERRHRHMLAGLLRLRDVNALPLKLQHRVIWRTIEPRGRTGSEIHVTCHEPLKSAGAATGDHMTKCAAGSRLDRHPVADLELSIGRMREVGIHDGPDTIVIGAGVDIFDSGSQALGTFGSGKIIARIREWRHPAIADEAGVPSKMVDMRMREDDDVHILRSDARSGERSRKGVSRKWNQALQGRRL
jgi:hypothetical protein